MTNSELTAPLYAAADAYVKLCESADASQRFNNELIGLHYLLLAQIHAALGAGLTREEILVAIAGPREICRRSPFIARTYDWPRGYQGDFETIEMLISQKNSSPEGTAEYWIEKMALGKPMAQQHRNKIAMQAAEILDQALIGFQQRKVRRILIVACGGSSDIARIQNLLLEAPVEITINDIDEGALDYSMSRLKALGNKVSVLHGNILLKLKHLAKLPKFDLILTGGLYDYLSDSQAAKLTRFSFERLLSDDGVFLFTNLAPDDEARIALEYSANWFMNYRTEPMIDQMLNSHGIPKEHVFHARDASGMAIITKILKNPARTDEQVIF